MGFHKCFALFLVLYVKIQTNAKLHTLNYNPEQNNFNIESEAYSEPNEQTRYHGNDKLLASIRESIHYLKKEAPKMPKATRDGVKEILLGVLSLIDEKERLHNVQNSDSRCFADVTRSGLRSTNLLQKYMEKVQKELRAKTRFRRFGKIVKNIFNSVSNSDSESSQENDKQLVEEQKSIGSMKNEDDSDGNDSSNNNSDNSDNNAGKNSDNDDGNNSDNNAKDNSDNNSDNSNESEEKPKKKIKRKPNYSADDDSEQSEERKPKRFKVIKKAPKKKKKYQVEPSDDSSSGEKNSDDFSEEKSEKQNEKKKKAKKGKKSAPKSDNSDEYIYSQGSGRHIFANGRKGMHF